MTDNDALLDLMNRADAVYLATVEDTRPRIRAMVNLRRDDLYPAASAVCRGAGFTIHFTTSVSSGKVREIRSNPAVSVYYCEPARTRGIMLSGQMEVLSDPALKRSLWDDAWRIYWPAGAEDPDYVVLRMQPESVTGWWGTAPFHFEPSPR
jgi:general stress protein 26